jgi:hypothetical protein
VISAKFMVCAQDVVRDAHSGSISLFNVFEDLQTEGFPTFIQQFAALVFLERDVDNDPAEYRGRFEIRLGEQVIFNAEPAINFEDKRKNRQILKIGGVVLPGPGLLTARFLVDGNALSEFSISVTRRQEALPLVLESTGD